MSFFACVPQLWWCMGDDEIRVFRKYKIIPVFFVVVFIHWLCRVCMYSCSVMSQRNVNVISFFFLLLYPFEHIALSIHGAWLSFAFYYQSRLLTFLVWVKLLFNPLLLINEYSMMETRKIVWFFKLSSPRLVDSINSNISKNSPAVFERKPASLLASLFLMLYLAILYKLHDFPQEILRLFGLM